jgi:hypothetical protein
MNPWWQTSVMHKKIWDDRASIDNNEWAAMMWIRNNTSSDALFITDRRGFFHESRGEFVSRFYGYSAISGRQFYCEGGEFGSIALADERESRWQTVNNLIYAKSSDKAKELWKKTSADYAIISLRFGNTSDAFIESSSEVFKNDSVVIYAKNLD